MAPANRWEGYGERSLLVGKTQSMLWQQAKRVPNARGLMGENGFGWCGFTINIYVIFGRVCRFYSVLESFRLRNVTSGSAAELWVSSKGLLANVGSVNGFEIETTARKGTRFCPVSNQLITCTMLWSKQLSSLRRDCRVFRKLSNLVSTQYVIFLLIDA